MVKLNDFIMTNIPKLAGFYKQLTVRHRVLLLNADCCQDHSIKPGGIRNARHYTNNQQQRAGINPQLPCSIDGED